MPVPRTLNTDLFRSLFGSVAPPAGASLELESWFRYLSRSIAENVATVRLVHQMGRSYLWPLLGKDLLHRMVDEQDLLAVRLAMATDAIKVPLKAGLDVYDALLDYVRCERAYVTEIQLRLMGAMLRSRRSDEALRLPNGSVLGTLSIDPNRFDAVLLLGSLQRHAERVGEALTEGILARRFGELLAFDLGRYFLELARLDLALVCLLLHPEPDGELFVRYRAATARFTEESQAAFWSLKPAARPESELRTRLAAEAEQLNGLARTVFGLRPPSSKRFY